MPFITEEIYCTLRDMEGASGESTLAGEESIMISACRRLQPGSSRLRHFLAFHVHHNETGRIPYLVCKVAAVLHPFVRLYLG